MNTAGDASEQIVRISIEGMEEAFKIAGNGAVAIGAMIMKIMQEKQQTKGKTRLTNMLKTGKELKIFTIKAEDLKKFSQEAKKYGVLYCALADKKNKDIDGMVDIMVREEDSAKVNRISERFNFANVDKASIARELEKEMSKTPKEKDIPEKSEQEKLIDDILTKPIHREEQQKEDESPSFKNTEEKYLSEHSLRDKQQDEKSKNDGRKSVREELKKIELELQREEGQELERTNSPLKKKEPKHMKEKEEKTEGKRYKEPKHMANNHKKKKKEKER